MTARGATRSLQGQDERNRMMVNNIDPTIELLAMVKPDVGVVAHTATSYYLGDRGGVDLLARLERSTGWALLRYSGQSCERWSLLELDLQKPVISSAWAIMWHALRLAGVGQLIPGYGCLFP